MYRKFFGAVLPSMMAFAFSGLYTIVDGFFIGNRIGNTGLAAISLAFPLTALLQAVGTGLGMGGAVRSSVARGKGEASRAALYLGNTGVLLLCAGALLTVVYTLAARPALYLLGARDEVLEAALSYLRIIGLGAVFQLLSTGLLPILRNLGGSLTAMAAMIAGFVTNIVLDALFIFSFSWGMAGAALATVIGQCVTLLPCFWFLFKKAPRLHRDRFRLRADCVGEILRVAASPFGLTLSPFVVMTLLNRSALVYGGTEAVAAYSVVAYVVSIAQLLLQGIGDGAQPLLSLAVGSGEWDKVKKLRALSFGFSTLVAFGCLLLLLPLRHSLPVLFGASGSAAATAAFALPFFLAGFPLLAVNRVLTSYFYATGNDRRAYVLVYAEPLLLALLLAFALPQALGLSGVWLSVPVSQAVLTLLAVLLTLTERRKTALPVPAES